MQGIDTFFFPDPRHYLLLSVCYLVSLVCAYRRYSQRADYTDVFSVPEDARPWTTWLRYHSSAIIYLSLVFIVFATIHKLLLQYPTIIDWARERVPEAEGLLKKLHREPYVAAPIITMLLLTIGVDRIQGAANWEQRVRRFFQRRGSIPGRVEDLIGEMKKYDLERSISEFLYELPEDVREKILSPERQMDKKTLEHMYLQACKLASIIGEWKEWNSPFHGFTSLYRKQHTDALTAFARVKGKVLRYFKLAGDLNPFSDEPDALTRAGGPSRTEQKYPKLLQELKKEVREELKEVMESMYVLMACGVNSEGRSGRSRRQLLSELGFQVKSRPSEEGQGLDINDLTVVALFLFFVIPLTAVIYTSFAGRAAFPAYKVFVVWSPMVMLIGLSSVMAILHVKKQIACSERAFWVRIRSRVKGQWFPYTLAGAIAGVAGVLGLLGLSYLDPDIWKQNFLDVLNKVTPWFFVPFTLAFVTGIHFDREAPQGRKTRIQDVVTTALATGAAALVGFMILKNSISLQTVTQAVKFAVPASALLGGLVGGTVPTFYRRTMGKPASVREEEVDVKTILSECMAEVMPMARSRSITLKMEAEPDIPRLKKGDPILLRQAVYGLISNALEFTQEGGEVVLKAKTTGEGKVEISVTDNGIGMEKEQIKVLLTQPVAPPHGQALAEIADNQTASLSQIKSILKLWGADLNLSSELFAGTSASMVLPEELKPEPPINVKSGIAGHA